MTFLDSKDELYFQSYATMRLLFELGKQDFLTSDYYKNKFSDSQELYKYVLKRAGIVNDGALVFSLYSMLVLSKEVFEKELSNELDRIDCIISSIKPIYSTTYKRDELKVKFICHIRNAVAHGNLSRDKDGNYVFKDESRRKEEFSIKFTRIQMEQIINKLQSIVEKIYKNRCENSSN